MTKPLLLSVEDIQKLLSEKTGLEEIREALEQNDDFSIPCYFWHDKEDNSSGYAASHWCWKGSSLVIEKQREVDPYRYSAYNQRSLTGYDYSIEQLKDMKRGDWHLQEAISSIATELASFQTLLEKHAKGKKLFPASIDRNNKLTAGYCLEENKFYWLSDNETNPFGEDAEIGYVHLLVENGRSCLVHKNGELFSDWSVTDSSSNSHPASFYLSRINNFDTSLVTSDIRKDIEKSKSNTYIPPSYPEEKIDRMIFHPSTKYAVYELTESSNLNILEASKQGLCSYSKPWFNNSYRSDPLLLEGDISLEQMEEINATKHFHTHNVSTLGEIEELLPKLKKQSLVTLYLSGSMPLLVSSEIFKEKFTEYKESASEKIGLPSIDSSPLDDLKKIIYLMVDCQSEVKRYYKPLYGASDKSVEVHQDNYDFLNSSSFSIQKRKIFKKNRMCDFFLLSDFNIMISYGKEQDNDDFYVIKNPKISKDIAITTTDHYYAVEILEKYFKSEKGDLLDFIVLPTDEAKNKNIFSRIIQYFKSGENTK